MNGLRGNPTAYKTAMCQKIAHLEGGDQDKTEARLYEFEELFDTQEPLAATAITQHRILTGNNPPVYKKPYRVACHLQPLLDEFIEQQLWDGIIKYSD